MILTKLEIRSDRAHFKIPMRSQIQSTFTIPQISTIVGILQNIYGENIDDFVFGFKIEHAGIHREIEILTKEVNLNIKSATDKARFVTAPVTMEYLINPRLTIYSNIESKIVLQSPLNLGRTNCLARITRMSQVDLVDKKGYGYNQFLPSTMSEFGMPKRVWTLTEYNSTRGIFDKYSDMLIESQEFEYDKFYDEEEGENIFLWRWRKGGQLHEVD